MGARCYAIPCQIPLFIRGYYKVAESELEKLGMNRMIKGGKEDARNVSACCMALGVMEYLVIFFI